MKQVESPKSSSPPSEKPQQPSPPPPGSSTVGLNPSDVKASSKESHPRVSPDPVLWAMEHMNLDSTSQAAAKAETNIDAKADAKGENTAEARMSAGHSGHHFPLPTGRPGRPPVSIGGAAPHARTSGPMGPLSSLQGKVIFNLHFIISDKQFFESLTPYFRRWWCWVDAPF